MKRKIKELPTEEGFYPVLLGTPEEDVAVVSKRSGKLEVGLTEIEETWPLEESFENGIFWWGPKIKFEPPPKQTPSKKKRFRWLIVDDVMSEEQLSKADTKEIAQIRFEMVERI